MNVDYDSLQPPDWEGIEKEMWARNLREVDEEAAERSDRLMERIERFVWRFGYDAESVLLKIREDEMFAAWFAKEPRRQSLHERIAAEFLMTFPELRNFEQLPQSGKNALHINRDGEIRKRSEIQGDPPSKSLDFAWDTQSGTRCYASHKYTLQGGGNQDSQFNEQQNFLRNFLARSTNDTALFVICDGPYYNDTRMSQLRRHCRPTSPHSYAVHIEEVPGLVAQLDTYS